MNENHCVICWAIIPEGRQVCPLCYASIMRDESPTKQKEQTKEVKRTMINWRVRFSNETFWVAVLPAIGLVITSALDIFGITADLGEIVQKLIVFVKAVFAVLTLIGVINDPTTAGLKDSERAMTYKEPYRDPIEED